MRKVKMLLSLVVLLSLAATAGMAQTVTAGFDCGPAQLILPGEVYFSAEVCNTVLQGFPDARMFMAEITVTLPNGSSYPNWRHATFTVINGACKEFDFRAHVPALPVLVGQLSFGLTVTDITQGSPVPPAGDVATDGCAIAVIR